MTAIIVDTSAVIASLDEAYADCKAVAPLICGTCFRGDGYKIIALGSRLFRFP